jgi:phosphomannomutase
VLTTLFATVGFGPVTPVAEQFAPDPDFPTVTFPNPEEPGAIDLALATAHNVGADIVLANDPDADRCALAAPDRSGNWRMLRGDELGSLLAWWITQRAHSTERRLLAHSIVSCSLLARIAEANGYDYARTLTGFKWIGRIPGLAYGYEEALGYCVDPEAVADKDGITAALLTAEMCAHLKFHGMSVNDVLDDLALTYGLYATDQVSVRVSDRARIPEITAALRANPPQSIAGKQVTGFLDLESSDSDLPPTDGLLFKLEGNARVIIRPSGTEPKVKCYLQAVVQVTATVEGARAQAKEQLQSLAEDVKTWLT